MKKIIAIFLAALILVSAFSIGAIATEYQNTDESIIGGEFEDSIIGDADGSIIQTDDTIEESSDIGIINDVDEPIDDVANAENDIETVSVNAQNRMYIPLWMQPNTIIIYDSSMNYTAIQGGELNDEDLIGREDIAAVGLTSTDPDMFAQPNVKVEYDTHGFVQNIYYPTPGRPGEYQLSNPRRSRNGSGMLQVGVSYYYGSYMNYDKGFREENLLYRQGSPINEMHGWGRITYYTGTTGDHSNTLRTGDCATKMYYDDVLSGTQVKATNVYKSKSAYFTKNDCGGLPAAILDIWGDGIKAISNNGNVDNVYTAVIEHSVP